MRVIYRKGYNPDVPLTMKDLNEITPFKIVHVWGAQLDCEFWVTKVYEEDGNLIFQCPENY